MVAFLFRQAISRAMKSANSHRIVLPPPDTGVTPAEFVEAWNDLEDCCKEARADLARQGFDLGMAAAWASLAPVAAGLATGLTVELVKRALSKAAFTRCSVFFLILILRMLLIRFEVLEPGTKTQPRRASRGRLQSGRGLPQSTPWRNSHAASRFAERRGVRAPYPEGSKITRTNNPLDSSSWTRVGERDFPPSVRNSVGGNHPARPADPNRRWLISVAKHLCRSILRPIA